MKFENLQGYFFQISNKGWVKDFFDKKTFGENFLRLKHGPVNPTPWSICQIKLYFIISVYHKKVTSGKCKSATEEDCEQMAKDVGKNFQVNKKTKNEYPAGCYIRGRTVNFNRNIDEKDVDCSEVRTCYCKGTFICIVSFCFSSLKIPAELEYFYRPII